MIRIVGHHGKISFFSTFGTMYAVWGGFFVWRAHSVINRWIWFEAFQFSFRRLVDTHTHQEKTWNKNFIISTILSGMMWFVISCLWCSRKSAGDLISLEFHLTKRKPLNSSAQFLLSRNRCYEKNFHSSVKIHFQSTTTKDGRSDKIKADKRVQKGNINFKP